MNRLELSAARTSQNRPVGTHRRLAIIRGRLDLAGSDHFKPAQRVGCPACQRAG